MRKLLKYLLLVGAFLALVLVFNPPTPAAADGGGWWDANWSRRKQITLDPHPENFQIKLTVTYDADMTADFSDLIFTENSADGRVLPYYITAKTNGVSATVWVRRLENEISSGDSTIWMYYGNAAAPDPLVSGIENADNTFALWDNFDTQILTTKWAGVTSATENAIWSTSGYAYGNGGAGGSYNGGIYSLATFSRPVLMDFWFYNAGNSAALVGGIKAGTTAYTNFNCAAKTLDSSSTAINWYPGWGDTGKTLAVNSWGHWGIVALPTSAANFDAQMDNGFGSDNYNNASGSDASLRFGVGADDGSWRLDNVQVTYFYPFPVTSTFAAEESYSGGAVIVTSIAADNTTIDRDKDNASLGSVTGTILQVDIEYNAPSRNVVAENVRFGLKAADATLIDNHIATSSLVLTDNKKRFYVNYSSLDNTLVDARLGNWTVVVYAHDNGDSDGYLVSAAVFAVDDMTTTHTLENWSGHRIMTSGTVTRVSGTALGGLDNVFIYDNFGLYNSKITGTTWENIRSPTTNGWYYVLVKYGTLDGRSPDNQDNYLYPDMKPDILDISSSQALIDRTASYSGSGSITSTILKLVVRDNDNDPPAAARIGARGATDALYDNMNVLASRTDNGADNTWNFTRTLNPDDNTPDAWMGAWDEAGYAADNWIATFSWQATAFTVDDLQGTINLSNAVPYAGWPLTVSGTISRVSGVASSVDNAWLTDNRHGLFVLGAGNAYSQTYALTSVSLSENISLALAAKDTPLDMENATYYVTNENSLFQIELRSDNNGSLIGQYDNFDNHHYQVKFWYNKDNVGETPLMNLSDNVENIVVPDYGENVFLVRVYDNWHDNYWRSRVPNTQGGVLVFLLPSDTDTIYGYTFKIEDYTQQFYNGWARMYTGVGIINEDWWDVSNATYAYLSYHGYYSIRLSNEGSSVFYDLLHFQAEANLTPDTWQVRTSTGAPSQVFKYDVISISSDRENTTGYIITSWANITSSTTQVTISVYDYSKSTVLDSSVFAYPINASMSWISGDNDSSYWVKVQTDDSTFGTFSDWFSLGPVSAAVTAPAMPWGSGSPVPLASCVGIFMVVLVALSFRKDYVNICLVAIPIMVGVLKLMGGLTGFDFMPIPNELAGLLMIIGILYGLSEVV